MFATMLLLALPQDAAPLLLSRSVSIRGPQPAQFLTMRQAPDTAPANYVLEGATLKISVSAEGKMLDCAASGAAPAWTVVRACREFKRAKFNAAKDNNGIPIAGTYTSRVQYWRWVTDPDGKCAANPGDTYDLGDEKSCAPTL